MSSLDATNTSFIMGFIVFMSLHRDTASQYDKGRNISVTRLRCTALDTMHWIAGQSEHTSRLRMMSFVKIGAFQKGGEKIMYSVWKMCFLTLNNVNTLHYTKYTN